MTSGPFNEAESRVPAVVALLAGLVLTTGTALIDQASGQGPANPVDLQASTPRSWVEAGAVNELRIIDDDGSFPLRYRVRKVDAKGDTMRDVIETRQGTVARLIQRDGRALTPAEDAAERDRLNDILQSPGDFFRKHKRDNAARAYSEQIVRELPGAMIYTYAPGQPQAASPSGPQVVIDFTPNPSYKPPTMICGLLSGLAGRMWIERKSKRLVRVDVRVLRAVDFGWGMLARVYPGGTVEYEQVNAGGDRWTYSHLRENVTIREVLVKRAEQRTSMDAANFELLPAPIDYRDAIRLLLATPLPH